MHTSHWDDQVSSLGKDRADGNDWTARDGLEEGRGFSQTAKPYDQLVLSCWAIINERNGCRAVLPANSLC